VADDSGRNVAIANPSRIMRRGSREQCDISISSGSNVMGWQPSSDTWRIAMKLVSLLLVLFAGVHSS
jgi:hypothetical protein